MKNSDAKNENSLHNRILREYDRFRCPECGELHNIDTKYHNSMGPLRGWRGYECYCYTCGKDYNVVEARS